MEEVDFYCLEAKCDDRDFASRRTNPRRYPSEENVQDFIPMFPAVLHTSGMSNILHFEEGKNTSLT